MDVEPIVHDIEQLQEMFEAPDIRPLSASDLFYEFVAEHPKVTAFCEVDWG